MVIIKASLKFKKEPISDNVQFGGNVTDALNNDAALPTPLFPDLPKSIKDLEALTADLQTANNGLVDGGRIARQTVDKAKAKWDAAMTLTAAYVSTIAAGDPLVVALGGFIPTDGTRTTQVIPDASATFKTTINGSKGAILAGSKKKVARAKAHVVTALPPGATIAYVEKTVIITIGGQKIYLGAYTGKGTELFNLDSGTAYTVSMFSINAAGHGPATAPQQVIPQ